ncbi:casein kinase II subunit alpha'-interacting protein isoform X2 [Callithrix jacchus]
MRRTFQQLEYGDNMSSLLSSCKASHLRSPGRSVLLYPVVGVNLWQREREFCIRIESQVTKEKSGKQQRPLPCYQYYCKSFI